MADTSKLPRWQSHKIVHAAKILKVEGTTITLSVPLSAAGYVLTKDDPLDENGLLLTVEAAPKMFARYVPVSGDYYVVYDDGYASISPKQAFEDGYHPIIEPSAQQDPNEAVGRSS